MSAVPSAPGDGAGVESFSSTGHQRPGGGRMYLAGLDGVRAIAVGGVLLYHSEMPWFQGGFLGVDVFFVLSGFLITGLLAREIERDGHLNVGGFYLRRFRRLVPAVLLLLVSTMVLSAFFVPDAAPRVKSDGLAALFYVSNWWLIASGQSYFEFISRPPLLQHLWSLAIEEQFYLVWPVVVATVMRLAGRRGLGALALLGATVSTWWMATLSAAYGYPDADPSRIYFGTDTHCMGLLLGAALAAVWQPWTAGALTRRANGGLALLGVVSCAAVAVAYLQVGERAPSLYSGGFLLLSMAVCGLIVAASHPDSWFGRLLERQPLRWIGERSYGLYLWHWPIYVVTRPGLDIPLTGGSNLLLRLALTCVVAELSYRFIEHPIRDGAIGRFVQAWRQADRTSRRPLAWRAALAGLPAVAMLILVSAALAITPSARPGGEIAPDVAEAMGIANGGPTKVTIERFAAMPPSSTREPAVGTNGERDSAAPAALTGSIAINFEGSGRVTEVNDGGLTAVGDSVLLGMRFQLEKSIRGVQLDAEVGRQAFMVLQRLLDLKAEKLLAPTVLIHIGTNSYVGEKPLRRTLVELADRQLVILVNAHAPRRWVAENNEMLSKVVRDYPNAVLIDFAEAATQHPEFFVSDDIHLSAVGQRALVDAVKRAGNFPALPRRTPMAPVARPEAEVVSTEPAATDTAVTEPAAVAEPAVAPDPATAPVAVPENSKPAETPEPIDPAPPVTLGMVRSALTRLAADDTSPAPVRHPKPMPLDRFWEAIARCETGGNWKNGGRYAGGLGIYIQTWEGWGGLEFAPTPDAAAPDEQILGLPRDGVYGRRTWETHVRHLEARQLPRALAPATPSHGAMTMLTLNSVSERGGPITQ